MPAPRLRTWAPPVAVAVVGAGAVLALAAAAGLGLPAAVQLAATWVVLVGVVAVLAIARRILHRLGRLDRLGALERSLATISDDRLPALATRTAELGTRLEREQRAGVEKVKDHIALQGRRDFEQQAALQELRDAVDPGPFMPALRGWAASPDVLCLLVRRIVDTRPKLVVECGSGASSVWLGYALRRAGHGRLVALEHDERYAELSRDLVASHGLADIVEVRHAPLRDWTPSPVSPAPVGSAAVAGEDGDAAVAESAAEEAAAPVTQPWYDLDALADLVDIDLLFVDGPPARTAPEARYPAGPVLLPRCATNAVVLLDDTVRTAEQRTSDRWIADHPEFDRTVAFTEKGTHVLTRR